MQPVPFAPYSAAFMLITAVLCVAGLLSRSFKDNLFQTLAMVCGMIGCTSRFVDLFGRTDVPLDWFLVHACMGLFAMGVAWKVISRVHKDKLDRIALALKIRTDFDGWRHRAPISSGVHIRRHDDP